MLPNRQETQFVMMISRSWGPVQTSLLNDAATSLVCWSGKCFANHSRVRGPDAQGCFYAMIYFEQILSFCIEIQTAKLQMTTESERERDAEGRSCNYFCKLASVR